MSGRRLVTRAQILDRLRRSIAEGQPIVGAGSSSGLIARSAEAGVADLIVVYNTGTSRLTTPTTCTPTPTSTASSGSPPSSGSRLRKG